MSTLSTTELQRLRLKRATFSKFDVAKTTDKNWYMLVDLSNASGKWMHKAPGSIGGPKAAAGVQLFGARGIARAADSADVYNVNFATVLKLTGTASADLAVFSPTGMEKPGDVSMDLTVVSDKLAFVYASIKAADTTVKSNVALVDPQGNNVLPQVGDLLFQVISNGNVAGAPTGDIEYLEASVYYDIF
jgi:hypothetical protein